MDLSRGALDLTNGQQYPLDGSEVPLIDLPSAQALLPDYAQGDGAGAMRDALLNTIRALANKIWADIAENQNGLQSPRFSDDGMLNIWGFLRQMPRYVGESTAAYRTRLLQAPAGVTPVAIRGAVDAAAALFNANVAYQEPASDGQFWTADDPNAEAWCSFWQPDNGIYWNYDPTVTNQTTGGYWGPDSYGALFWIIMPLTAGSDSTSPFWTDDNDTNNVDPYGYWADDVNDYGYWAFDGDPLESQIVSIANAMKAFGIRWMLIEDPNLVSAR
jgi:hypothetical protein